MSASWEYRLDVKLGVALGLCACVCLACFLTEVHATIPRYRWRYTRQQVRPNSQHLTRVLHPPSYAWLLCFVLGMIRLFVPGQHFGEQQCTERPTINPDIGGIGVRIGLYVAMGWTLVSLLLGAFGYCGETCTKELGTTLFVNLIYIAFNLLKALLAGDIGELNFTEIMTACMCIDGFCTAVTMTFSDKTTLASRWYVYLTSAFQILAFIVVITTLGLWGDASKPPHCCTGVAWWGNVSSCKAVPWTTASYLTARAITSLHGSYLACLQTPDFDAAKKLHDRHYARGSSDTESGFERLPATAFSAYCTSLPAMIAAYVGLEKLLQPTESGSVSDWGQSAALITATAGVLHWSYVFIRGLIRLKTLSSLHSKYFDPAKNQFLDYTRLNVRRFPDPLEMVAIPQLQEALLLPTRIRDDKGAVDIMDAIKRRERRGEQVSVDFVDSKHETPLLLAIERGSRDLVLKLLEQGAIVEVPQTEPAILTATKTGQWDILHDLLDTGRCGATSIIRALETLDKRFEERSEPMSAAESLLL